MSRRIIAASLLLAASALQGGCAAAPDREMVVEGGVHEVDAPTGVHLDHVPIAVGDLNRSTRHWHAKLGFSMKPGRLHPNTFSNMHMKFVDATELELITAARPTDPLTARYRQLIDRGDGGAFLALRPDTLDRIARLLSGAGTRFTRSSGSYFESIGFDADSPYRSWFFITLTAAPVDLPEHVAHANTGHTLYAAWLRKRDFRSEERLLATLGIQIRPGAFTLTDGKVADEVVLDHGRLYLLAESEADDDRPLAGVTIAVASIDSALAVLQRAGIAATTGNDTRGRYARVEPRDASGVWLEYLQLH